MYVHRDLSVSVPSSTIHRAENPTHQLADKQMSVAHATTEQLSATKGNKLLIHAVTGMTCRPRNIMLSERSQI